MIWSYHLVKYFEQCLLWPKQIWAIKAMDSRTYYRGIFRLLQTKYSFIGPCTKRWWPYSRDSIALPVIVHQRENVTLTYGALLLTDQSLPSKAKRGILLSDVLDIDHRLLRDKWPPFGPWVAHFSWRRWRSDRWLNSWGKVRASDGGDTHRRCTSTEVAPSTTTTAPR